MSTAGMPPKKQQQSEEQLPAIDDEERLAVQTRVRARLDGRSSARIDSRSTTPKSATFHSARSGPKSSSRTPGYMTPKSTNRSSKKGAMSSRSSAMLTNRTSSPTGRYHPDPERKLDIRKADVNANIDYFAPHGAPDNDGKAKESSWLVSQAFIEGLRYYPQGQQALDSNDCAATYSGNTHHKRCHALEHLETDLRSRLDIAPADAEWREDQLPREWVPEKRSSLIKNLMRTRERLKR